MNMKRENIVRKKSFSFALKIIDLYRFLVQKREYVLSRQILRSGTSIGANIEEAQAAVSRKDFVNKIGIASKEARETRYWLLLLIESEFLVGYQDTSLIQNELEEIIKILTSIVKTTRQKSEVIRKK